MTSKEEQQVKDGLTRERDNLQKITNEARHLRAELGLSGRQRYTDFLQKLGELSFLLGAAIVPVIIVSNSKTKISYLAYALIGVGIYLLNGLVALWCTKTRIEQDIDDAPLVALEEEIHAQPVVNSLNKLIFDLNNEEYQKEHREVTNVADWFMETPETKPKISILLDVLIFNFVIASLFVARTVWAFSNRTYWITFACAIAFTGVLITLSYKKAQSNQKNLQGKRAKLKKIRDDYQKWFDDTVMKR